MKTSTPERDIEVVEHIIGQLKKCMAIYYKQKMYDEFRVCLNDLQFCKDELTKLIYKQKMDVDIPQGEAIDGAKIKRGAKTVL